MTVVFTPFHLHIDCSGGISARSLLDGLRALARSGAMEYSKDAFELDSKTATIWAQYMPDMDRTVLQEGGRVVGKEAPVESWEPFRRAIRETAVDGSEIINGQLTDLIDAIELFYDDEVQNKFPIFPSVVWHMMAVILLLNRMRIKTFTSSAVPRSLRYPSILDLILKKFPVLEQKRQDTLTTTFDGAVLLYVLKPVSPISPDRVFLSKAIGRDAMIETALGLTEEVPVTVMAPPPEMAPPRNRVGQPMQQARAVPPPVREEQHTHVQRSGTQRSAPTVEERETNSLGSPLWNVDEDLTLLQTNIDDMTAEHLAFVADLLLQQGAADAWLKPILMKKGRPGTELNCLCRDDKRQELLITFFKQTTTLGVRVWTSTAGLKRVSLRREIITVDYCHRPIQVKVAYLGKDPVSIKPEFDQCAKLSRDTNIPIIDVTEEVKALAKDATRRKLLSMSR